MTTHAHAHNYPAVHRYGLWMFIISEAFLFAVLLATRFALAGFERPEGVNILLGIALTVILVSSSRVVIRAERALEHGDHRRARAWLGVAIGLAAAFLVLVGIEWAAGFTEFPASTPYGSVFYLITGTHALHLFSGAVVLAFLAIQAGKEKLDSWKLGAGALYWHFVDVVWLTVFTTLYLL